MSFLPVLAAVTVTITALAAPPARSVDPAQGGTKPETAKPDQHQGHGAHATSSGGVMPILKGLGDWHHRVTTKSPEAQRYFDQGLRLTYGFNHDEAVRSFERAVQLDPDCAMCHWGIAYALGPNINLPMEAKVEPRALEASRQAVRLKSAATAGERALIEAMAVRYGEPAGASRAERDAAYANAMRTVARTLPGRRRRAGAVRRRDDEPPALESVDA